MFYQLIILIFLSLLPTVGSATELMASQNYLLLGESGHGQAASWKLTANMVCQMGSQLDAVGFEMEQDELDAVFSGEAQATSLGILYRNDEAAAVFSEVIERIKSINAVRLQLGMQAVKVLGIDLPKPAFPGEDASEEAISEFMTASQQWMQSRDRHMMEQIVASGQKGLFHIGAAHAYKLEIQWPEEILNQFGDLPASHSPLGKLINEEHPELKTVSFLVGSYTDTEANRQFLPEAWLPFWEFLNRFESLNRSFLYPTHEILKSRDLEEFFEDDYAGLLPVRGFDVLSYWNSDYEVENECPALDQLRAQLANQ